MLLYFCWSRPVALSLEFVDSFFLMSWEEWVSLTWNFSFFHSKPLKWSSQPCVWLHAFYLKTEKYAATYFIQAAHSEVWGLFCFNCIFSMFLAPHNSLYLCCTEEDPLYVVWGKPFTALHKQERARQVLVLICGVVLLYFISLYSVIVNLSIPYSIGPHRELPDWWLLLNLMTYWDPLSSFSKGPSSTPTDFVKHWEHRRFVDAQSVWQLLVTVGTDLHHILF